MEEPLAPPARGPRWWKLRIGCGLVLLLAVGVPLGIWQWRSSAVAHRLTAAEQGQAKQANDAFAPALAAMSRPATETYDIDKTIRVIHALDRALAEEEDLEGYLEVLARQDYRDVAPEVLQARKEILDVLLRLYARQVEAEDQKAMWEVTSELLLSTLSVVAFEGEASLTSPAGAVSVDRAQAQELLRDLKREQAEHKELVREMAALETELLKAMVGYSEVAYAYVDEWDQLTALRDRAYLAAHGGHWDEVIATSELAIERAPKEREAHLLEAWARIERDDPEDDEEVVALLEDYMAEHPGSTAPAYQLLGMHHWRRGRSAEATLAFQQAAAYYPRQAQQLADMLDPYRSRQFLRKSREGDFIVELYRATMLGAGTFSPDLQMAAMLFQQGRDEEARVKVLDHFARRRAQEQWDFLLSDLQFCHELLGPDFWTIFPENTYLDLEVAPPLLGSGLQVEVVNRSATTLHNATLVLALHLTGQYPGDYDTVSAGTRPAVLAHDTTSFGTIDLAAQLDGRGVDDIVQHRAILVSDEAVSWVDSDEFKISESEAFRDRQTMDALTERPPDPGLLERHPEFRRTVDKVVGGLGEEAALEVGARYGSDDVLVELPRELALLRPIFRLKYGDEIYSATDNVIEGDAIHLRFASVENFDGQQVPTDDLELLVASPFGDVALTWKQDGVTWRLAEPTAAAP